MLLLFRFRLYIVLINILTWLNDIVLSVFGEERDHPDVIAHLDVVSLALNPPEDLRLGRLHRHFLV